MTCSKINKLYSKQLVLFYSLLLAPWFCTKAQITVGSLTPSAKGSLLELKTQEAISPVSPTDANNITSAQGGLGLPRVHLVDKTNLEPFIPIGDSDWVNATTSKIKEKHIGLMVYNIYTSPDAETNRDKIFRQGVYTWNGKQWELAFQSSKMRFFPCPPFNLPLPAISQAGDPDLAFDLYAVYEQRFTKTENSLFSSNDISLNVIPDRTSDKLYLKNELDYVVVHYDESILSINSIDTYGVMKYRIKAVNPKPSVFINILFVIKD